MGSLSEDKQWASKYLLDPLIAPEPSEETGPGSHFVRPESITRGPSTSTTAVKDSKSSTVNAYPTPPTSASPTQKSFHPSNPFSPSYRQSAFGEYNNAGPSRNSHEEPASNGKGRRRGSSLGERYPGDMSHRPLDQLRKDAKAANRSPHLKKKHIPGADIIDSLDKSAIGGAYHHEGPYDATLLARNTNYQFSPVAAVQNSNNEALKATPRENIRDALDKHVPLQGTAVIPSGMEGIDGKKMEYEEGADLMRESDAPGGAYKRWEGIKYLPEDLKGKGEPSFTVEKALKDHKHSVSSHRRIFSDSTTANTYEMQPQSRLTTSRLRSVSGNKADLSTYGYVPKGSASGSGNAMGYVEWENDVRRSHSTGRRVGEGLKKRFGSLRRKKNVETTS